MNVNLNFSDKELETMRTKCYRHWVAKYEGRLVDMAWDMLAVDDFPNGGWSNAVDEDIVEYFIKKVKPAQPAGVE